MMLQKGKRKPHGFDAKELEGIKTEVAVLNRSTSLSLHLNLNWSFFFSNIGNHIMLNPIKRESHRR